MVSSWSGALAEVLARARALRGQAETDTLGIATVKDFCRYAVAVGDEEYVLETRAAETQGGSITAPALFLTGILGWADGPRETQLRADGLAARESPCTDGLAVSQVHGGARVEVTALPAAGTVIHSCRELVDAEHKYGSSGDLVILKLRTCFTDGAGRALSTYIESLVVRTPQTGRGSSSSPKPSKPRGELVLTWTPSRVQLFRFSAVTWNAHRVHYDLEHAHREGFPDVLVHSTLQAEMLAQAALTASERRGRSRVRAIEWRNLAPACAGTPLRYFVDIHEKDHVAVTAVDPCDQPRASAMVTVTSEEL